MGFFSKKSSSGSVITLPLPKAGSTPSQQVKQAGPINLSKGSGITLSKSPLVTARCTWPPSTDYDVYALVLYRDGHVEAVSTFGTKDAPRDVSAATRDGAVKHLGDVGRSRDASASESVEVRLTPEIIAVVPVVYSAQSNGGGSFREYAVGMSIDNGQGQHVQIGSQDASNHPAVYSCIPGVILNEENGVRIEAVDAYSGPGSENRPSVTSDGESLLITMDAGPTNAYK